MTRWLAAARMVNPSAPKSRRWASRAKSDEGKATPRTPRNEKAVKLLKTNNSAKSPISRPNDFKDLRPPVRNRSFRTRNESFRFRAFLPSPTQSEIGAEARMRLPKIAAAPPDRCRRPARLVKNVAHGKKVAKLRKVALKPLKSLTRVTLCAGAPDRVQARGPSPDLRLMLASTGVRATAPPPARRPHRPDRRRAKGRGRAARCAGRARARARATTDGSRAGCGRWRA